MTLSRLALKYILKNGIRKGELWGIRAGLFPMTTSTYAAGILPYTFFNGQVYLLLGKDIRDNFWSDFGGKSEQQDEDKPMSTAIREFYEESCGIVMDPKSLRIKMNNVQSVTFSSTQNNKTYYMYAIEIPYNSNYRGVFRRMIMYLKYINMYKKTIEKTDIKWVNAQDVYSGSISIRPVFYNTFTKWWSANKVKLVKCAENLCEERGSTCLHTGINTCLPESLVPGIVETEGAPIQMLTT
jgi:hypothetical protein